jgi:polysaccharide deacetylase 2 family uncharacterized protein YibQ
MQSSNSFAQQVGILSIVLDDMGYNRSDLQALSLPKEISFSILPFTPLGKLLAKKAHQQGRELLLHIPMEAKSNNSKLGKGALMVAMQEKEFKATLKRSLHFLPDAQGINNHMGSRLTEQITPMRWTMEVLKKQGLYFLDSRTSRQTIAEISAKTSGIPALRRHVFLDNIKTEEAINKEFQRAIRLTKTNKAVVIIAHPYPVTLRFLQNKFTKTTTNLKLITLSQLIPETQRLALAQKKSKFQQANNRTATNIFSQTQ